LYSSTLSQKESIPLHNKQNNQSVKLQIQSKMKTYSQGKVVKDPATGKFVSAKNMKPVFTKERKPRAPKVVEEAAGSKTVEILSALYGIEGNRISITPILGKKLNNKMAGSDPAPKTKKDAIIKAMVEGTEVEKTFTEGEVISF
jgi:hypothetical protein